MYRILLVDEDSAVTSSLARLLHYTPLMVLGREWRSVVETFDSPIKALARMEVRGFDLALSGFHMADIDGVGFLRRFHELQPDAARVLLSSYADFDGLFELMNEAKIDRFVTRPWRDLDLVRTLGSVLERRGLPLANRELTQHVAEEHCELCPVERKARRLEQLEPGITKVQRGPDGVLAMDP